MKKNKLNLGCGSDIKNDYINVDCLPLPGVDIVLDLSSLPWPFIDEHFDEVRMISVLEHLPDTVAVVEELWRILKMGGKAIIMVPYWNCKAAYIDPTHIKFFHQESFNFYDPSKYQYKERPYLSSARFTINNIYYITKIAGKLFKTKNIFLKVLLGFGAKYLNNIIWFLEFELYKIEKDRE